MSDDPTTWPDPDLIPDDPTDPWWAGRAAGGEPWPAWVEGFRPWQVEAAKQIVDAYRRGVDVVCLDAPTGAGKTIIGEMVRRCAPEDRRATYICHSLSLQDQFVEDFPYAKVLKGRANYPTELGPPWVTAADCEGRVCGYCDDACPYRVAKGGALGGRLAVVNTAYWLHETNGVKDGLRGRGLLIVDEADVLESALMGFVEFKVSKEMMKRAGVKAPVKGARTQTVEVWCRELAEGLTGWGMNNRKSQDVKVKRASVAAMRLAARARVFGRELGDGGWVREYVDKGWDQGAAIWKAVKVDGVGGEKVWQWVGGGLDADGGLVDGNVLAMSATLISAQEWAESCGVEAAGLTVEEVRVPSPFDVANRPIIAVPVANMGYKTWQGDLGKLCTAIDVVLDKHPHDKVLLHSTSYQVTREVVGYLESVRGKGGREWRHEIITHTNGRGERDAAIEAFKGSRGPAVVVSPSLDRGVDLPGELCRVQIIAKVPFASLGDRQVSERLHLPGGQIWYDTSTARTLVQMTGRGVRSADDHATTYIFDSQFHRWYGKAKRLLPAWWTAAVKPGRLSDFSRQTQTNRQNRS